MSRGILLAGGALALGIGVLAFSRASSPSGKGSTVLLGDLTPRRVRIIQAILPLDGLEPTSPAYVAAVYPFDTVEEGKLLATHQSSCGLVTEIGWRAGDVLSPILTMPIQKRTAHGGVYAPVSLEYDLALKSGAWIPPTPAMPDPTPGDAMIIGAHGLSGQWSVNDSDVQHEFTVIGVGPRTPKGVQIDSLDGGQPGIKRRTRWLVRVGSEVWLASISAGEGKLPAKGRKLFGSVNVDRLPSVNA